MALSPEDVALVRRLVDARIDLRTLQRLGSSLSHDRLEEVDDIVVRLMQLTLDMERRIRRSDD